MPGRIDRPGGARHDEAMKVYVNGRFVESDQAALSIHDAAVQHAVGLFETMQAFDGKVYRLDAHLQRLVESAAELGLSRRLRAGRSAHPTDDYRRRPLAARRGPGR